MITTPHALFGATIAVLIPYPPVSVPLAFASHFALDAIPHWQETLYPYTPHKGTWIRVTFDMSLSLVLVYMVAQMHPNVLGLIWTNTIVANLPDADSLFSLQPSLVNSMPASLKRFIHWHIKIQRETSSLWGVVPQVLILLACLLLIFKL